MALLGGGAWTRAAFGVALENLHRRGELRVIAGIDLDPPGTAWLAREFPRARAVAAPDAIDAPPDTLLIIASPLTRRPARIAAALRRGWHVFSACPPAEGAGEAARLGELARQHEVTLSVDLPHRLETGNRWLQGIASGRALGRCTKFRACEGAALAGHDEIPLAGAWIEPGVRALDLLAGWLGSLRAVSAADDALGGVEATAKAEFAFGDDRRGTLVLDRDWRTPPVYELTCRRGTTRWEPGDPGSARLRLGKSDHDLVGTLAPPGPADEGVASLAARRERQLGQLLGALLRGAHAPNDISTLLPALELADQCRRIRTMLPLPWLSANEAAVAASCGNQRHAA